VTLTALKPQYQCILCREFDPEFTIVAKSWRTAHPQSDGVFFAKLDVVDGRPIFLKVFFSFSFRLAKCSLEFKQRQMYGCILRLLVLSPNYLPIINPSNTISLGNISLSCLRLLRFSGINAEVFQRFLISNPKLEPFPLVRPFNWTRLLNTLILAASIGMIIKLAWTHVQKIATNRNLWAVACLVH
jgi:oligosaccharyltransferase complex subunit gamma